MKLRHVYHRHAKTKAPSGKLYASRQGMVVEAASEEDYEWLKSLKFQQCGCGSAKPRNTGHPVYQPLQE